MLRTNLFIFANYAKRAHYPPYIHFIIIHCTKFQSLCQ